MKPVFNLEPKYRATMLTREEWTIVPGTPAIVKGLRCIADESTTAEGNGLRVYGQSVKGMLSIPVSKHATAFQGRYMQY